MAGGSSKTRANGTEREFTADEARPTLEWRAGPPSLGPGFPGSGCAGAEFNLEGRSLYPAM